LHQPHVFHGYLIFSKFQNKSDFPIIISPTLLSFCQFIITFPTILYHVLIIFLYFLIFSLVSHTFSFSHHFPIRFPSFPQKKHGPRAAGALPKPDLSGEAPNDLPFAKGELPGPGPMAEPWAEIMGKHGENMGKTWGKHGKTWGNHGNTWGKHGKNMGKTWENMGKSWENIGQSPTNYYKWRFSGILGRSCGIFHREMKKEILPANCSSKTMKQPKCGNHNVETI
jgi:hypothetical protein